MKHMKHIFRKGIAVTAAAITVLSAGSMHASAYDVTHKNFTKLTYVYRGAGAGYCWGTAEKQDALPKFTPAFLNPAISLCASFVPGQFGDTRMFCVLDRSILTSDMLRNNPTLAENARKQIDKISVKCQNGSYYGLKLEHEYTKDLCEFGLRLMSPYNLNDKFSDKMFFDTEELYYDSPNDIYYGRIYFEDLYVAGMRLSSSDQFTVFSEPVIEWQDGDPFVYVDFSGRMPNPNHPVFEGVYDKLMTRKEFDQYFDEDRPDGYWNPKYEFSRIPILTDLTVTYNCGKSGIYQTNEFATYANVPYLVCCD